jgi:UDP-glucose 4-epimerase
MNNVLVTGASGFIGKFLVQKLLHKKCNVRALIRTIQKSSIFPKEIDIFKGDLTNPDSLTDACSNIDTVFHLGGYAHAWEESDTSFADHHHSINFQGTKNMLDEALRTNVKRFIFFSSVKAVADSENYIDESWEKLPHSPYGIAKRKSENLVLAAKNSGMHVCVLRPALVYGPGWKGNLAAMLTMIDRGLLPPLPDVTNYRSMISIHDICEAAILTAEHPHANGRTYFVTDGIDYSSRQLYLLMCESLGKRIPHWQTPLLLFKLLAKIGDAGKKLTKRRMPFDSEAFSKLFGTAQYNSGRIQRELRFKPVYDLKKMLPDIVRQYKT